MKVKFVEHAKERMMSMGTSEEEVKKVLLTGTDIQAMKGRKATEMTFPYGDEWLGKFYQQKKVMVIYIEENDETVVITTKVLYGHWE